MSANIQFFLSNGFSCIAANGKSICEGRAKFNWKFNFDRTKQLAFSDYQITKKSNMESKLRLNATNLSTWFQPRLLQIQCYLQVFLFVFRLNFRFKFSLFLNEIFKWFRNWQIFLLKFFNYWNCHCSLEKCIIVRN